ncbi:MAG: hypothetical protein AAF585_21175, partial [Verrucomicrobiota bacterium]
RAGTRVTQIYGSALPVSYTYHPSSSWEPFARFVLEASYEATLRAAFLNAEETGNRDIFLTLLGGGAFGNEPRWIFDAIQRSLCSVKDAGLQIHIVSFRRSNPMIRELEI